MTGPLQRPLNRAAAILGVVVFTVLAGVGVGHAAWTASVQVAGSAIAASTSLSGSGADGLTTTYTDTTTAVIAPITVTNTGSAPLSYSLTVGSISGTLSPGSIALSLWVRSEGTCGSVVPATGVTTGTLAAPPAMPTGAAEGAAGTTLVVCAATRLTSSSSHGQSISASFAITGRVGTSWSTSATAGAFTQSVNMPPVSCTNMTYNGAPDGVRISWNAVSGATGYYLYTGTNTSPTLTIAAPATSVHIDESGRTGEKLAIGTTTSVRIASYVGSSVTTIGTHQIHIETFNNVRTYRCGP